MTTQVSNLLSFSLCGPRGTQLIGNWTGLDWDSPWTPRIEIATKILQDTMTQQYENYDRWPFRLSRDTPPSAKHPAFFGYKFEVHDLWRLDTPTLIYVIGGHIPNVDRWEAHWPD